MQNATNRETHLTVFRVYVIGPGFDWRKHGHSVGIIRTQKMICNARKSNSPLKFGLWTLVFFAYIMRHFAA